MTKHGEKLLIELISYVESQAFTPDRAVILKTLKELKHFEVSPDNKSVGGSAYT